MPTPGKITKARVRFLSLCKRGKNRMPVMYKSDDGVEHEVILESITKELPDFEEEGKILTCIYPPRIKDADGQWTDNPVIEDFAYGYMQHGQGIDINHNEEALDKSDVFLAESWMIPEGDPRFVGWTDDLGNEVDVSGGWGGIFKVDSPKYRSMYKSGEWNGISIGGECLVDPQVREPVTKGVDEMDFEQFLKAFKEGFTDLGEKLAKGVSEALKAQEPAEQNPPSPAPKDEPPKGDPPKEPLIKFEGDPNKVEDVKAHAVALRKAQLTAAVDWNDITSVEKYHANLQKLEKAEGDEGEGDEGEIKKLKLEKAQLEERILKAERRSNQPGSPAKKKKEEEDDEALAEEFLQKSTYNGDMNELLKEARELAQQGNRNIFGGTEGGEA